MNKVSYALGMTLGANLKGSGVSKVDFEQVTKGLKDIIEGNTTEMSQQEAQVVLNDYFTKLQSEQFGEVKEKGQEFLKQNAKREEVSVTESGLQYEIITKGEGAIPTATDTVKVHYHGTLIDGTVFDSSVQRNDPATFGVTQVIKGWVEALQMMTVGSKWKLYIPYELAYGAQGAGQTIKPYSALVFEVELLDIVK
ncbi:MAG: peptidylprolyl isomerase [Paludibacter sp.]|nr:MAG: peptidylprolyl isomerase [Paludibacter sp.]